MTTANFNKEVFTKVRNHLLDGYMKDKLAEGATLAAIELFTALIDQEDEDEEVKDDN